MTFMLLARQLNLPSAQPLAKAPRGGARGFLCADAELNVAPTSKGLGAWGAVSLCAPTAHQTNGINGAALESE